LFCLYAEILLKIKELQTKKNGLILFFLYKKVVYYLEVGTSFTLLDNNSGTAYLSKNKIVAQPQQINGKLDATIYF